MTYYFKLICLTLVVSIWQTSAIDNDQPLNMHRRFILPAMDDAVTGSEEEQGTSHGVPTWNSVIPSPAPETLVMPDFDDFSNMYKRNTKSEGERELDSLGGANLYHLPYNRYVRATENVDEAGRQYVDGNGPSRLQKRALDTLGNMQIHEFKRRLDSLGGSNLHSGYNKRFLSSLGGSQIHDYKRLDSLGGSNLHAFKRFISSLGGNNIYGYKRTLSNLGGANLHDGYKRYLSSLGGGNIYDYKRSMDTLGGNQLHAGYKRFLSSLGGSNIHSGGYKRALSSLGGMNLHNGYKRALSSLGGSEIFGYKRADDMNDGDDVYGVAEKRNLDTLGGFDVHRYKRSNVSDEDNTSDAETKDMSTV